MDARRSSLRSSGRRAVSNPRRARLASASVVVTLASRDPHLCLRLVALEADQRLPDDYLVALLDEHGLDAPCDLVGDGDLGDGLDPPDGDHAVVDGAGRRRGGSRHPDGAASSAHPLTQAHPPPAQHRDDDGDDGAPGLMPPAARPRCGRSGRCTASPGGRA